MLKATVLYGLLLMKKFIVLFLCFISASAIGQSKQSMLSQIMSADTLGVQVAYIENIIGPAKRINESYRQYSINGCTVNMVANPKEQSIQSIELVNIDAKCNFDTSRIFLSGLASNLTFKDVIGIGWRWLPYINCLGLCGNTIAQTYGAIVEGPRVMNFMNYSVTTGAGSYKFLESLKATFPKKTSWDTYGEALDPTIPIKVYSDLWYRAYQNEKINSIQFGYDLMSERQKKIAQIIER
jgi:hypothetical protein